MRFPVALRYVDVHPRILPRRRKAVNFTMTVWIRFRLIDELQAVFDRQAEAAPSGTLERRGTGAPAIGLIQVKSR